MNRKNILIIGAAGRDFHNFNTYFRDVEEYNVVAFTAAQIPDIDGRKYPAGLAGKLYPEGIPIFPQDQLPQLIKELKVKSCVFSYSDLPYQKVMAISAIVNAAGANFVLLGTNDTMIESSKPVISVCAVRTGCGKSQTSRRVIELLMEKGLKVVAIRHPMPYGDLMEQKVQRFARTVLLHTLWKSSYLQRVLQMLLTILFTAAVRTVQPLRRTHFQSSGYRWEGPTVQLEVSVYKLETLLELPGRG